MTTITKMALFATPKNIEALQDWIEAHPPEERVHLWTAAGMAWNLAAELANEALKENDDG